MVESAIVRELERHGYLVTRTHKELDLCRQDAVESFLAEEKSKYVFLEVAMVDGIADNQNALAKIYGLKYCEFFNKQYGTDYILVMPTNLYGHNDNYHPTNSHVLPVFIRCLIMQRLIDTTVRTFGIQQSLMVHPKNFLIYH